MLKLVGLWMGWSLILLNSCEIVRSQKKDDVHESQDGRRRGNTTRCVSECCANWKGQQGKDRERIIFLCCKEIGEAVSKISG